MLTEIIRNGVLAVTEEMKTNLTRTAYNMIIYEALDFTVGLYTAEGETVSIGLGLPMFIRGMAETIKAKLRHFGVENLHPGDILATVYHVLGIDSKETFNDNAGRPVPILDAGEPILLDGLDFGLIPLHSFRVRGSDVKSQTPR